MQAHRITDSEFSSLPTPTVSDQYTGNLKSSQQKEGSLHSVTLAQIVHRPDLLPTPAVGHIRNNDEPIEDYLGRRAKAESGEYKGMPGVSLGVAVRMEMLPTPKALDVREAKTPEQIAELQARSPGGDKNLRESVVNDLPETELLRTPSVTDSTGGAISEKQARNRGRMVKVADQVAELAFKNGLKVSPSIEASLLPTPKALDGIKGNLKTSQERLDSGHQIDLPNIANDYSAGMSWGKFEAAIRRWEETFGREAPAPTKPDGKEGAHRLSADFVEWMMGLPEGWVCSPELGLKRNDQLKALGNGVVPQQAELALRLLITEDIKAILET